MPGKGARIDRWSDGDPGDVTDALELIQQSRSTRSLPHELAARLSAELGVELSGVRIHDDARAHRAAAELKARAFTIGSDIFFAEGAYDPGSDAGVELIAHEVAHVAQQARGTAPTGRGVSQPGDQHEREAHSFARSFQSRKSIRVEGKPGDDPASLIDRARREGRRTGLPFQAELEEQLGASFDFVEQFTGPAAQLAREALGATASVVHSIISVADPSPQRERLLHELTRLQHSSRGKAPAQFALGALRVSESEAGAAPEARTLITPPASSVAIHREGEAPKPEDETKDQDKRIKLFLDAAQPKADNFPKKNADGEEYWAFYKPPPDPHHYMRSSEKPWNRNDYATVVNASALKASDRTYTRDLAEMKKAGAKETNRIANVTDQTWAFIMDGPWADQVDDIRPDKRSEADPVEQFKAYYHAIKELKAKGRLVTFSYSDGKQSFKENNCTMNPTTAKAFRELMRDAIAKEYAAMGTDGWQKFYDEVMGGAKGAGLFASKFNGVTGSIFERIVRDSTGSALRKEKPIFVNPPGKKLLDQRVDGDDVAVEGQVIIDSKASKSGIDPAQCKRYYTIIKEQIPGYFGSESADAKAAPQHFYKAVAYTVAGKDIAEKVKLQITGLFPDDPAIWDKFHISPSPDDLAAFLVSFNPTVRLQTKASGKASYTFDNPPSLLSGVKIKRAVVQVDPQPAKLTGGSMDMAIDMGNGAIKNENIPSKPIAPAGTGNLLGGTVPNKFDGFKSTLDKVLGAVTIDGKLIDGGVEATIALKAGAAKIPQFDIDAAQLTARYVNGALSIDGEVGITHKSKKVSGTVKVGWEGNSWSFDGRATLAAGMVPGLSAVTLGVKYAGGKTKIYAPNPVTYERKVGAIDLKGTVRDLEYNVDTGGFSGGAELNADMGMFGKATAMATLENNELKSASFSYDSPEFKYPPKAANPAFKGTVGGTLNYSAGKFSGDIRGTANLNIPGLKAIAGEGGVGLAVDAHINADGTYSGTVKTTSPLTFGKYIQVPSVSCTIKPDGSMEGTFEIKIVKIKYLKEASVKCKVTKEGVEIEDARIEVPFGNEEKGKFWGSIVVGYSKGTGLSIGGTINYKIKEGMIATGTLTYKTETSEVSLEMTVSEITLLDKTVSKTLFKAAKQIPIINVYGLGVYIDIGFELGFNFGFKLGFKPTVKFEDLSLETFEFKQITGKLELLGKIFAELVGTPKLGLGVFALDPSILRGGGGLKVPIVGRAEINPTGTLQVVYAPGGGVTGDAKVGMNMTFGITGSVKPYAEFAVLDGLWNPTWEGDALTSFEILKPKELFNFVVDLAGDMTKKDAPALPAENSAKEPTKPDANRVLPETKSAPAEKSGPGSNKEAQGPTSPVAESGDEGPFSLSALKPMLEQLPGAATVKRILQKAGEVWDKIKNFFGRIVKAFKGFFENMVNQIEEILDGFAKQGLGYLPTLVKKIVGDTVYEIIEPLIKQLGDTTEQILKLFETNPPKNLSDFMPWVWQVAKQVLGIAFDSLSGFISAIQQMLSRAAAVAKKLVNRAVTDGWIGVKRHSYYIWRPWPFDDYRFMAASEYKLNIPNVASLGHHGPPGFLATPSGAIALGLYELLEDMGVPITYGGQSDTGEPYNDRWRGPGARG